MKRIFKISILLLIVSQVLFLGSCLKNEDLITADAKVGGLIKPVEVNAFKLAQVHPKLEIVVPSGTPIKSIEYSKSYYRGSDKVYSNVVKAVIDVNGENASAEIKKALPSTWDELKAGIVMPSDPQIPATETDPTIAQFIGDSWNFTYKITLMDGRVVESVKTTTVSIANFFAGAYDKTLIYRHPAYGTYPANIYGGVRNSSANLTALSATDCWDYFGVWTDNKVTITIGAGNTVNIAFNRADAKSGDPYDATKVNSYDPATGIINIYYYYAGGATNDDPYRIFWATYTPKK